MEVQVSVMFDSPKGDLGPSPTDRTSRIWRIDVIDVEEGPRTLIETMRLVRSSF